MPRKTTTPEKIITPPELSKLEVGGERPPRADFVRKGGSKWKPLLDKAKEICPQWIHWSITLPCEEHARYDIDCKDCVNGSKEEAKLVIRSLSSAVLMRDDYVVSNRSNEIWIRALREDEIGNYVDPDRKPGWQR